MRYELVQSVHGSIGWSHVVTNKPGTQDIGRWYNMYLITVICYTSNDIGKVASYQLQQHDDDAGFGGRR
jgi:hypothetical protein